MTELVTAINALYAECKTQLESQGTWQDTDAPILEQYCSAVVRARVLRRQAEEDPFVEGSKKQLVAHPGFRLAAEAEESSLKYAKELLLTPKSRRSAGIENPEEDDALDKLLSEE